MLECGVGIAADKMYRFSTFHIGTVFIWESQKHQEETAYIVHKSYRSECSTSHIFHEFRIRPVDLIRYAQIPMQSNVRPL